MVFTDGLLMWASRLVVLAALMASCIAGMRCVAYASEESEAATDVYVEFDAPGEDAGPTESSSGGQGPKEQPDDVVVQEKEPGAEQPSASRTASSEGPGAAASRGGRANAPSGTSGSTGKDGATPGQIRTSDSAAGRAAAASGGQPAKLLPQTGDAVLPVCLTWVVVSGAALAVALLARRRQGDEE